MVRDIRKGSAGSYPSFITPFVPKDTGKDFSSSSSIFFLATDGRKAKDPSSTRGFGGSQMWKSDGTFVGTVRAYDQTENDVDIDRAALEADYPKQMGVYKHSLFYSANEGVEDELLPRGKHLDSNHEAFLNGLNQMAVITDIDEGLKGNLTLSLSMSKGSLTFVGSAFPQLLLNSSSSTFDIFNDLYDDQRELVYDSLSILTVDDNPYRNLRTNNTSPLFPLVCNRSITLQGSVGSINALLRDVVYEAYLESTEWESIELTVSDQGLATVRETPLSPLYAFCNHSMMNTSHLLFLQEHADNFAFCESNEGNQAAHSFSTSIPLFIEAVNRAPTILIEGNDHTMLYDPSCGATSSSDSTLLEGGVYAYLFVCDVSLPCEISTITIDDPDIRNTQTLNGLNQQILPPMKARLEVEDTLVPSSVLLSLGRFEKIVFLEGDGVKDEAIEIMGNVNDVRSAVESVFVECGFETCDTTTVNSIRMTVSDLGYTGKGGAQETTELLYFRFIET